MENRSSKTTTPIQFMKTAQVENTGGVIGLGTKVTQLPPPFGDKEMTPAMPSFKLKQILVPVDFSQCTEKALLYAVPFARQFGAALTLLHVVEPPYLPASEMGVVVEVESREDAQKELEKLGTRLAATVPCQTVIRKGSAQIETIDAAKALGSDLIILGTHGRTGVERLLMGSTVEKVVRRAGCPILIVRPHEHDFITDRPTDWQMDSKRPETDPQPNTQASI